MFKLNEEKVNNKFDKHLSNCDIRIYSNEHSEGHLELKTVDKKYYVYIPSVEEWKLSKTIVPLITSTKKHKITSELSKDLILWFMAISKVSVLEYTNIEYCRSFWNIRNIDNPVKNLVFFKPIKDVKYDPAGNEIKDPIFLSIGSIKIELLKESLNYLRFKYKEKVYELVQNKIYPESDFLQKTFDLYYE